ncbi:MAG: hypothetical protein E7603_03180 [Ruminococcaceae bacterium]|nr:hypothetical protein [Oscillospiraceae bacterium]
MHWKDLKTFAIAVLLVVDAVFVFCIFEHWHAEMYYRNNLIDSAVSVFEASGLHVDSSFLEKKKESLPVYQGMSDLQSLSESLEYPGDFSRMEEDGLRLIGEDGTYFFGYDFSFFYSREERFEMPSELIHTDGWALLAGGETAAVCECVSADFLKSLLPVNRKYKYIPECLAVYGSGEESIAVFSLRFENRKTENKIFCRVSQGKVVSADGMLCTAFPDERKKAENIGLCNLLFEEKAYIDALDASERKPSYTVADVSYSYGVYFDENIFYFIPLCRITYADGESRTYNFISGELYVP